MAQTWEFWEKYISQYKACAKSGLIARQGHKDQHTPDSRVIYLVQANKEPFVRHLRWSRPPEKLGPDLSFQNLCRKMLMSQGKSRSRSQLGERDNSKGNRWQALVLEDYSHAWEAAVSSWAQSTLNRFFWVLHDLEEVIGSIFHIGKMWFKILTPVGFCKDQLLQSVTSWNMTSLYDTLSAHFLSDYGHALIHTFKEMKASQRLRCG